MIWTVALAALFALVPAPVSSAAGSCAAPTGLGATVIVPESPAATLPGGAAPTDVVIEVHTAEGGCVGRAHWSGGAVAVALWADDPTTEAVEGFVDGETAELVLRDTETGAVFRGDDVEVDYVDGFDVTAGLEVDRVYVVSGAGDQTRLGPTEEVAEATLNPPAPNPVHSSTSLSYELTAPGPARLSLFDALGREVAVVHDVARAEGLQRVQFDASRLSSGMYVLRLESEGAPVAARMTVVR